jgi:hypothetical protein
VQTGNQRDSGPDTRGLAAVTARYHTMHAWSRGSTGDSVLAPGVYEPVTALACPCQSEPAA